VVTGGSVVRLLFYGARLKPGQYDEKIDHYNVLATLEAMFGLPKLTDAIAISDVWDDATSAAKQ
jgi:acid phosphatase